MRIFKRKVKEYTLLTRAQGQVDDGIEDRRVCTGVPLLKVDVLDWRSTEGMETQQQIKVLRAN